MMHKALAVLATIVVFGTASTAMLGCDRREGPMEEAGEELDKAADAVDDAVDPKGPVEKAGRAIDRATD